MGSGIRLCVPRSVQVEPGAEARQPQISGGDGDWLDTFSIAWNRLARLLDEQVTVRAVERHAEGRIDGSRQVSFGVPPIVFVLDPIAVARPDRPNDSPAAVLLVGETRAVRANAASAKPAVPELDVIRPTLRGHRIDGMRPACFLAGGDEQAERRLDRRFVHFRACAAIARVAGDVRPYRRPLAEQVTQDARIARRRFRFEQRRPGLEENARPSELACLECRPGQGAGRRHVLCAQRAPRRARQRQGGAADRREVTPEKQLGRSDKERVRRRLRPSPRPPCQRGVARFRHVMNDELQLRQGGQDAARRELDVLAGWDAKHQPAGARSQAVDRRSRLDVVRLRKNRWVLRGRRRTPHVIGHDFAACLSFIGRFLADVLERVTHDQPREEMIRDRPQVSGSRAVGEQFAPDRVDGQGDQVVRANDFEANRRGIVGTGRRLRIAAADPVQTVRKSTGRELEDSGPSGSLRRHRRHPCPKRRALAEHGVCRLWMQQSRAGPYPG